MRLSHLCKKLRVTSMPFSADGYRKHGSIQHRN
uniref:Uncharacterized protein n=1 Tax=Rhizophora mucronata TaxID=61149 RepID=A0A2P2JE75_RHIMU